MLVVIAGLPGTGKSVLAREILRVSPGVCLDKDAIRPVLFTASEVDYTPAQDDVCMEAMLLAADYLFRKDPARLILLDGRAFARRPELERVIRWAQAAGVEWRIVECVCSDEVARERLERDRATHPARNRDFDLYRRLKAIHDPILFPHVVVDTNRPVEECGRVTLEAIRER
ncbi:MAG: AAA family ATPase [Bryobacteraceae bacterium]